MTRRLLVLGRSGQLATSLARLAEPAGWRAECLDRSEADFTAPDQLVGAIAGREGVDAIINAVACNDVDGAENDDRPAQAINALAPARLAQACAARDIPLLHVSTDYVFPGRSGGAYRETDEARPLNAYGRSKLDGETAVLSASHRHAVFRTAWVFNGTHNNFVTTMLRQIGVREEVRVVADQIGNPTHADTLASGLLQAAGCLAAGSAQGGLFHLCSPGPVSRSDFAAHIYRAASHHTTDCPRVIPIPSADWPSPAQRPANSSLDCKLFETHFQHTLPHWRAGVEQAVSQWAEGWAGTPSSP
ncbi:dTDP-4-dehydrorhamnose reductase [Maricaulis sp.]|uniref:dTDP-4-dehydrorhamnose reductase n=1 Tax=Maricaulis sp. TaxID=1486257 RepID=UPI002B26B1BF|nr:dTDP-4-dehydrorhamnose reductase [Maricaulis sp.]